MEEVERHCNLEEEVAEEQQQQASVLPFLYFLEIFDNRLSFMH
jgi:hypothetical protein